MYSTPSLLNTIWKLKDFDERYSLMMSQHHNIAPLLGKLLNIRNISDNEVNEFLYPNFFENLPDPFKLKDMDKSIEKITTAILNGQLIGIIADYDVDGSTSAAILCKFFKSINQKFILKIPNRLKDGYGPNEEILDELLNSKINILLTLDCGTTSFGLLDKEKYLFFDTIVIDHHISDKHFPNVFSIINPNRFDESNDYQNLAAVGVVFLFILALRKKLRMINYFKSHKIPEPNLLNYLDLVALGTVCDVVSLQNYNRVFVSKGIEIMRKRMNKGITSIIDNSRINHSPTSTDLGYLIGPQLNSASRIDDSSLSSKLLISEDLVEIESIARKLFIFNEKRKLIEKNIFDEALQQTMKQKSKKVIIVYGEQWHKGVLGIVASKLVEKFNKPAIVISFNNEFGIGSARSVHFIDLNHIIMDAINKGLLINGGGHKMAAGFKISKDKYDSFVNFFDNKLAIYDSSYFHRISYYDLVLTLNEINLDLLENIEKLEPFGNNNPEPKFIIQNVLINYSQVVKGKHVLVNCVNDEEISLKGISFNSFDNALGQNLLNNKFKKFDIGCSIKKDTYQGNIKPNLIIHDAKLIN